MRKKNTILVSFFPIYSYSFLLYFSSPFSFVRSRGRKPHEEEKRRQSSRVSVESERSEEDAAEDTEDVENGSTTTTTTTTKTNGTSLAQKFFKER